MAYDAATFCKPDSQGYTRHFGLDADAYAYASSPIRRYCDLVNQRALKSLTAEEGCIEELITHLNRRQKQAKAFSRDLFFMTELSRTNDFVEGTVISVNKAIKIYVPVWKRSIKVRFLSLALEGEEALPAVGSKVSIDWYCDREQVGWKERIVFKLR